MELLGVIVDGIGESNSRQLYDAETSSRLSMDWSAYVSMGKKCVASRPLLLIPRQVFIQCNVLFIECQLL